PIIGINLLSDYWMRRFDVVGVGVMSVQDGSPADQAGMVGVREDRRGYFHLGDVIVAINAEPVTNQDSLLTLLEQYKPGDRVEVTTLRDDEERSFDVTLVAPEQ
ncbi:MAG: PDZ domain-containing protein, partial [Pseudomonadales bacterium]